MKTKIIAVIVTIFVTLSLFAQVALIGNWQTVLNNSQEQKVLTDINFTNSLSDISKVIIFIDDDGKARMLSPIHWNNYLNPVEEQQMINDIGFTNFLLPEGSKISIIFAPKGKTTVHWNAYNN